MNALSIDEQELPFSEEEFYRAFRLIQSDSEARETASAISAVVTDAVARKRAITPSTESTDGSGQPIAQPEWMLSDEGFALLALVSENLRIRVDRYMRQRWEAERPALIRAAMHRMGHLVTDPPTPEAVHSASEVIANYEAEWTKICEQMREEVANPDET